MENLKEQIQVHPADVLAKALERASGLLNVLGQLFDGERETFSGGNTFVAHAISTSSTLVADAKSALDDLHYSCDLTVLHNIADNAAAIEMNFTEKSWQRDESVAEKTPPAAPSQEEHIAQTYLELLRKLTAAEIFAAEQQALSVPGSSTQLLPLLRSLREDIEKIHTAA